MTFDEFLGNGDDQVFANTNLFGGASQFLDSAGNFGYLGGPAQSQGLTILGPQPRSVFGTNEYTSISTFGEWSSNVLGTFNNAFTQTLDVGAPSIFTINQDQTYTSSFVLHDSAFGGRIAFTGSGRYLLNGQDPATLYTGDLLTHFNFVTPLLLNSWTSVAHETQTYEVLDGQFAGTTGGNTLTFFSTGSAAIPELPPQPLGAPWQTTGLAAISGDGFGITLGSIRGAAVDGTATLAGATPRQWRLSTLGVSAMER